MPNHRRTALGSPKAKTPQDALWSWLLARATARRLKLIKRLACRTTRPHSTLRGLDQLHRLDATLDGLDYTHTLFVRVNTLKTICRATVTVTTSCAGNDASTRHDCVSGARCPCHADREGEPNSYERFHVCPSRFPIHHFGEGLHRSSKSISL